MIKQYLMLGACAAAFASGIAADRFMPLIGANAVIERTKISRDSWKANAGDWTRYGRAEKAAFNASEQLRRDERAAAVKAINEVGAACSTRVARARASAVAIENLITKEPRHDASGCPVRALVDPSELRDAIYPNER